MHESYDSHFVSDVLYHKYAANTSDDEEAQQIQENQWNHYDHNYIVMESTKSLKRRNKLKCEKTKTIMERVTSLSEKNKSLISSGCADLMQNSFSGEREEIQRVAMTPHFYSTKAFFALLHPDTWHSNMSADPGFTEPSSVTVDAPTGEEHEPTSANSFSDFTTFVQRFRVYDPFSSILKCCESLYFVTMFVNLKDNFTTQESRSLS